MISASKKKKEKKLAPERARETQSKVDERKEVGSAIFGVTVCIIAADFSMFVAPRHTSWETGKDMEEAKIQRREEKRGIIEGTQHPEQRRRALAPKVMTIEYATGTCRPNSI